jgi:hypothetical protein
MKNKNIFPYVIIIFGILVALFSFLVDVLGWGKSGFQVAQILMLESGVVIILLGVALIIYNKQREEHPVPFWLSLRDRIYNLPSLFWVTLGVLPASIAFLITPMFFDPILRIRYPEGYLPKLVPIGNDILLTLGAIKIWLETGQTNQFVFTPLAIFFFSPLFLLSFPQSYYVVVIVTLVSYLILSGIAILISDSRNHAVIAFIAVISIFSYGMQFELERGQSHTIALMLSVLAVYIFHKQPRFRLFAYLLFCLSVQLKFYPALFIVLFVDDWRDWKDNLIRFGSLGLANFLAFFLLGFSYFSSFYTNMIYGLQDGEISMGNHSIKSFVAMLQISRGLGLFDGSALNWIYAHFTIIQNALYLIFLICFLTVLVNAYLKNTRGINPDLLLVCVIGGLVIPSVNHDYTLPLLTIPFALSLSDWHTRDYPWPKYITIELTIAASFIYSLTLFSIVYKPIYLQNSLPMIFVILILVTLFNVAQKKTSTVLTKAIIS